MTSDAARATSTGDMLHEARALVDEARARGVTLRLVGGLAVRAHCREPAFCERPCRDIDLVALRRAARTVDALLTAAGWTENRQVAMAAAGRKQQFFRGCRHATAAGRAHVDDRVDLYLDAFRLHHAVDLRDRLDLDPYTVSLSDVLLVKLQRTQADPDDVHDMLVVLESADSLGTDDRPGVINLSYLARLCAADWGLWHDVERNVARCRTALAASPPRDVGFRRAPTRLDDLAAALAAAPRGWRWRLRAAIGERLAWHEPVDDAEGVAFAPGERP
jgi:hypothetical protein